MKVLYVASEAYPFASSGGLSDVAGALPKELRRRLIGCRVVLPLYQSVPKELRESMRFITSLTVPVSWRRQYLGLYEAKLNGITYYLLDNEYYFDREKLYGYYDDAERFAFFARAALEIIPHIEWKPDIIHCNDWQSALTPVYYALFYAVQPGYEDIKTVFTIHNIQYQGKYGMELLEDLLGIPKWASSTLEYDKCVNFMKGAIELSNRVTTVSPTYAEEILDPWYSEGMDDILKERRWKLSGILNGIDTVRFDPATDQVLEANYSTEDLSGKKADKLALQSDFELPQDANVPVIGMVSRLVAHKGIDLVKYIFEEMIGRDIQLIVLGSGENEYERFFYEMSVKYPEKMAFRCEFNHNLSRRIYAGSDMFLMPSKSEPCGLSQMLALRYGSVPVVRETGGLKDTVHDSGDKEGNGFTFKAYNAHDMLGAVDRALTGYKAKKGWDVLVKRAMECDNSWGKSANEYIKLYRSMIYGS